MTQQITIPIALLEQIVGALETGIDLARNHAEDVHESYKGYYPERHAAADRDVVDMAEALARARNTAMTQAAQARIPECGEFGAIAQDLDFVCTALAQQGEQQGDAKSPKPVAYLTETEQGDMVWTPEMYGEACTYCDDGEFPTPLYTAAPAPQPVAPHAWAIQGSYIMFRGEHAEMDAKAEANRCGGTCYAYPLYCLPPVEPNIQNYLEKDNRLSDDEILSIAHRKATRYTHAVAPWQVMFREPHKTLDTFFLCATLESW